MKFKFISGTQQERNSTIPIVASAEKHSFILELLEHNRRGLSTIYNEAIDREQKAGDFDALVLVHDDVYLTDVFWKEKLEKGFENYDIIGLAGTSYLSLKNMNLTTPIAWHNSPKDRWVGSVEHQTPNKDSFQWTHFGPAPAPALTIDGLFIAVNLKTIEDVRFDEDFAFHFYDLCFCLDAYKKQKNVGVANIHTTHMSRGEGILNKEYNDLQAKFIKKWEK